jgi:nickel-dependent lactate racemase
LSVFEGDFVAQHRAVVKRVLELYETPFSKDIDIVVSNVYPTENQARKSVWPAKVSPKEGGIAVIVTQTVEGQALHYLTDRNGTNYVGKRITHTRMPPTEKFTSAPFMGCPSTRPICAFKLPCKGESPPTTHAATTKI